MIRDATQTHDHPARPPRLVKYTQCFPVTLAEVMCGGLLFSHSSLRTPRIHQSNGTEGRVTQRDGSICRDQVGSEILQNKMCEEKEPENECGLFNVKRHGLKHF